MIGFTWIVAAGAASRIGSLRTGRDDLLGAIYRAGSSVVIAPDDGNVPPEDVPKIGDPVAIYGGHRFLDALIGRFPDLARGAHHGPEALSSAAVIGALGDACLNAGAEAARSGDAAARLSVGERIFVRPDLCDKAFAGRVYGPDDAETAGSWPDVGVLISEPKLIVAEYRFVIVSGRVVTGSQYARGGVTDIRRDVSPECEAFAREAAAIYAPCDAFVCDVAETGDGPKVVEYNSFSAAGLYACDANAIVEAIEEMTLRAADEPSPS